MEQPEIREVSVHWGGGGKVQLEGYGKQSSEYSCNITRKYAIPADWDEDTIAEFEGAVVEVIRGELEPILAEEHESRMQERERIGDDD